MRLWRWRQPQTELLGGGGDLQIRHSDIFKPKRKPVRACPTWNPSPKEVSRSYTYRMWADRTRPWGRMFLIPWIWMNAGSSVGLTESQTLGKCPGTKAHLTRVLCTLSTVCRETGRHRARQDVRTDTIAGLKLGQTGPWPHPGHSPALIPHSVSADPLSLLLLQNLLICKSIAYTYIYI